MSAGGRSQSVRLGVAISVWGASWGLVLASLAIGWIADLPAEPLPGIFLSEAPAEVRTLAYDIDITVAIIYGPVSALILARRPWHPVAIILSVYAVGSGLAAFGIMYGLLGAQLPGLPLWGFFTYTAGWAFVPGTFLVASVPLLVTRRRIPRWQRAIVVLGAALAAAATFISLTQQGPQPPQNPFGIEHAAYQAVLAPLYTALSAGALAISTVSCVVVFARWLRMRGPGRMGLAWLALGQFFVTLSYLAQALPAQLGAPPWVLDFALLTPVLGQILFPAAIIVVVLGQRLWGVEVVVSRLLLWTLLSFSGVVLYLAVVAVFPVALSGTGTLALLAPVVIALGLLPLRSWLQGRIDRLIYGEGADPGRLLRRLGDRMGELSPGPEGLRELAETLRRVLKLGWVSIQTAELDAAAGVRTDAEVSRIPFGSAGSSIGELHVHARPGQRLDRRTVTVLSDVAGLVATVARLAQSYIHLESARDALTARRSEERRAIRRELHDGLGPALAGIGFGLAAVENLAPTQPARARALLAELADDMHERVREVRALADEVSAPPRDTADLAGALTRLARRFDSPGLRVRTDVTDTSGLPASTAETLYLVAAEAVSNAVRHSGARVVTIRLRATGQETTLEVHDNGTGIPTDALPGVGMTSMRERVAPHNGTLTVSSSPSGTAVTARMPLDSAGLAVSGRHALIEDSAP
jgi:signal transduction histidine kinase